MVPQFPTPLQNIARRSSISCKQSDHPNQSADRSTCEERMTNHIHSDSLTWKWKMVLGRLLSFTNGEAFDFHVGECNHTKMSWEILGAEVGSVLMVRLPQLSHTRSLSLTSTAADPNGPRAPPFGQRVAGFLRKPDAAKSAFAKPRTSRPCTFRDAAF